MFWLFYISEKMTKSTPPRLEARQQPWQSQPAKDQASGSESSLKEAPEETLL